MAALMTRQNIVFCLVLLILAAAPAFVLAGEAHISEQETIGGLTCFTVTPVLPKTYDPFKAKSCKTLCADQGAACSGVTSNISPIPSCEESAAPNAMVCRCCKVDK